MIQFTKEEQLKLKEKCKEKPYIIKRLKEMCLEVYESEMLVPKEGIANWGQYYYCPDCSVHLTFNRKSPFGHECPKCHKILTGEPYDSSWWGTINSLNSNDSYYMGLLYLLTDDLSYARKAIDIMLEYSKYYNDYQVHGDIPYNDSGKAGAQTLDEAIFIRGFALSFDLLFEAMTERERTIIKEGMLIPGGEFLMEHRHSQVHNHEVITDATIGVLGILFEREDFIQLGLYDKYGLIYQLEHGMLDDHMWFEGTFGYHYYALSNFFAFEKFAVHTKYSNIHHPNYQKMLELITDFILPDNSFPMLNDINFGHGGLNGQYLYEFAYKQIQSTKLAQVLNRMYEKQERYNMDAFFYGVDDIPEEKITIQDYHSASGAGNTVLHGPDDRYFGFKYGNYGGEHDHYDKLAISYVGHGQRITPDLGTTGYGAILHYDYYKNTGTHNTVTINEENQSPACGKVLRYEKVDGITYVEAEVNWNSPYEMPDSFTIVQWDEKSYKNVKMTRKIAWTGTYFVDLFLVEGARPEDTIDWSIHLIGERKTMYSDEIVVSCFTEKKPLKHLHEVTTKEHTKASCTQYQLAGGVKADLYAMDFEGQTYYAKGPDNPSISDIEYVIERKKGGNAMFFHVLESYQGQSEISNVVFSIENGMATAAIDERDGNSRRISFEI